LGFLHIFANVVFVEAAIGQDDDEWAAHSTCRLGLCILEIEELVGIPNEVCHGSIVTLLGGVLELVLAYDEGRPLIGVAVLEGL